jgi:hypothetical protein
MHEHFDGLQASGNCGIALTYCMAMSTPLLYNHRKFPDMAPRRPQASRAYDWS